MFRVLSGLLLVAVVCMTLTLSAANKLPNVLMIAIDDLRTEVSIYPEGKHMHTPNFDRLAAKSLVFDRAYVSVALCSPSRTALLLSRRPDTTRVWTISPDEYWRTRSPPRANATTLPQTFLERGFKTVGCGKVFHEGSPSGNQDIKYSWSPEYTPLYDPGEMKHDASPAIHVFPDDLEPTSQDGNLTTWAVNTLKDLASQSQEKDGSPFFFAFGAHRPHIPWFVPQRFMDMYPMDTVTMPPHPHLPVDVPDIALQAVMKGWSSGKYSDLSAEAHLPKTYPYDNTTLNANLTRAVRQAYWAAVSYTDDHIGQVLDALDQSGVADNTIILLWSDHGYQLGDNNEWAKQDNFEHATRIVSMLSVPGKTDGGMRTSALIEEVDFFPTLVELVFGSPPPSCSHDVDVSRDTAFCTEGFSLVPLLSDPDMDWRSAAFSQYERNNEAVMGYTMRMDTLRYTEWRPFNSSVGIADWTGAALGVELYNHSSSPVPDSFNMETVNVAGDPRNAALVQELHKSLKAGWRGL